MNVFSPQKIAADKINNNFPVMYEDQCLDQDPERPFLDLERRIKDGG